MRNRTVRVAQLYVNAGPAAILLRRLMQSRQSVPCQFTTSHQGTPPHRHVQPLEKTTDRRTALCTVSRVGHVLAHNKPSAGFEEAVQSLYDSIRVGNSAEHANADYLVEWRILSTSIDGFEDPSFLERRHQGFEFCFAIQDVVFVAEAGIGGTTFQCCVHTLPRFRTVYR